MTVRHNTHTARCRELVERLSRLLDNDLTAAERRAVLDHVRRCPCCDDFVESLRRTVRLCRDAGATRLPAAVRARAHARIRRLMAGHKGSSERQGSVGSSRRPDGAARKSRCRSSGTDENSHQPSQTVASAIRH